MLSLAGAGLPLVPTDINTALLFPLPFVQLAVVVVAVVFVKVTLVACVVGTETNCENPLAADKRVIIIINNSFL